MDLDPAAIEAGCIAHIKFVVRTGNRPHLVDQVDRSSIEEHRSFLRKHPEVEQEVRAIVTAYLRAAD